MKGGILFCLVLCFTVFDDCRDGATEASSVGFVEFHVDIIRGQVVCNFVDMDQDIPFSSSLKRVYFKVF